MKTSRAIGWIVWKDLVSERRSREMVSSMFFFAAITLLILSISLAMDRPTAQALMPGLVWIVFGFAGVIGLGKSFMAELQNDCLESLQISPIPKAAVYVGKLSGNILLMLMVEISLLPVFVLLFDLDVFSALPIVLGIVVLGTVGLAALGTLFSAMTAQTRAREVLLPILLLPPALPVIIGAVEATRGALLGDPLVFYRSWLELLVIVDIIFVVLSFWLFEFVFDN